MESKTHYRKVFKSDHLGVADLEDFTEEKKSLLFTIKQVKQEINVSVAGRKGDHNIAYFKEDIKPLVLNAGNSAIVKKFSNNSPFVEDWSNVLIEVYIDPNVKMKGEIVGGVRIRKVQPVKNKPVLNPDSDKWETAKTRAKDGMSFEDMSKHYSITKENYTLLCG
jgi:hypothetical protein